MEAEKIDPERIWSVCHTCAAWEMLLFRLQWNLSDWLEWILFALKRAFAPSPRAVKSKPIGPLWSRVTLFYSSLTSQGGHAKKPDPCQTSSTQGTSRMEKWVNETGGQELCFLWIMIECLCCFFFFHWACMLLTSVEFKVSSHSK